MGGGTSPFHTLQVATSALTTLALGEREESEENEDGVQAVHKGRVPVWGGGEGGRELWLFLMDISAFQPCRDCLFFPVLQETGAGYHPSLYSSLLLSDDHALILL